MVPHRVRASHGAPSLVYWRLKAAVSSSLLLLVGLVEIMKCRTSAGGVEGLLHRADLVAEFGGGKEVHLFGGLLHLALCVADFLAELFLGQVGEC